MNSPTADEIARWVVRASLDGADACTILQGACERLIAAGVPLMRAALVGDMLDPSFDGVGVRWSRQDGASLETFLRTPNATLDEEWLKSPFHALVTGPDDRLRRRLDRADVAVEFPVLGEFRQRGGTDYLAMIVRLGEGMWLGDTRGVVTSWLSAAPQGFGDGDVELIAQTLPPLATMFLWRSMQRSARTLMTTYLGSDAAERVLAGNVARGRAESIHAVVWYSDLVGFTRIADAQASQVVLAMLNDYAEVLVESIEAHGGHVLKFIGDGMLAIFPDRDESNACEHALDAATDARRRLDALNATRAAAGLPVSDADVALHIGELLYGNVGSPRRLDFTVLGSAVNEAARIEALCGSLDQRVIVSSAFVQAGGDAVRARLVSLGRYAMKGVARPQELYTLDPG